MNVGAKELIREHLELARIRAARHGWDDIEDELTDLLDRLDGWCSPHRVLPKPRPVDAVARMAALGWPDYDYLP